MKEEVAKKFSEALRSGSYTQGEGALRRADNKFCCLGVLCDLSRQGAWKQHTIGQGYGYVTKDNDKVENFETAGLPRKVIEWAGISGVDPASVTLPEQIKTGGTMCSSLIGLNDVGGYTFEMIADYIDTNWAKL